MRFWRNVAHVIDEADVIIEVVDARMPFLARNEKLDEMLGNSGKVHIIAFNKSDLVSEEFIESTKKDFLDFHERLFFVSAKEGKGIPHLRVRLKILAKKMKFDKLKVGVVGYPNVGKSAIINALVRRAKTKVSKKVGTTRGVHWVSYANIKILDSPGVIPNYEWDEVKLGIIGAKDINKIKDIERVALAVIDIFLDGDLKGLCKSYGLDYEVIKSKENWEILEIIGEKKRLFLKGGIIDEKRAAYMIIRDWQTGKLIITG